LARTLRLSQAAKADSIAIWSWIADANPQAADKLLDRFDEVCAMLADHPLMGRPRDDLAAGLRAFLVGEYLIFYRTAPGGVEVVRVLHGRRDIGSEFA
jgi:toxin ParE1/3/4